MSASTTKKAKPIECIVVSDKLAKTRVGEVHRLVPDPRCGKYQKKTTRIVFHDEKSATRNGDVVTVMPSRPLSATKKFVLVQVKRQAPR